MFSMSSKAIKVAVAAPGGDVAKLSKTIAKRDGEIANLEYEIEANADQNTSIMATAAEGLLEAAGAHGAGKLAAIRGFPTGKAAWGLNSLVQLGKQFTRSGSMTRVSLAAPNGAALAGVGISSMQAALARRGRSEQDYENKIERLDAELSSSMSDLRDLRKKFEATG